jgi:hypothetical protein
MSFLMAHFNHKNGIISVTHAPIEPIKLLRGRIQVGQIFLIANQQSVTHEQ